ncbi:MAG TPA: type IV pilus modification protein PilV [Burkholderiaceae bacterium]|nr:type IV pilus modification protein PilV [Burkholderiaceae bacterium]
MSHTTHLLAPRTSHDERGFSLLEVLVGIVVLSFGLLGAVGLQAYGLQANREARLQSAGVQLARELAELMRANKDVAIKAAATDNPYLIDYPSHPFSTTVNCFTAACGNTQDVARWDVAAWLEHLDDPTSGLPGARVVVCFDSTPFDAAGMPQWECSNTGGLVVIKIGWTRGSTDRSAAGTTALERATRPGVVLPVTAGSST